MIVFACIQIIIKLLELLSCNKMPWFYSLKGKGQNLEIFPNENNL
jgi:hypothetical protein